MDGIFVKLNLEGRRSEIWFREIKGVKTSDWDLSRRNIFDRLNIAVIMKVQPSASDNLTFDGKCQRESLLLLYLETIS